MKQLECPHCGKQIKVRTKISLTIDDGKPKETIPREAFTAILSIYCKAKGMQYNEFNTKIHGKHAKQLYFDMEKDVQSCLDLITNGAKYFSDKGLEWSWKALKEHKDSINDSIKGSYVGW